jgi:DNA polymerase III alpha subunit (gram-positive type)
LSGEVTYNNNNNNNTNINSNNVNTNNNNSTSVNTNNNNNVSTSTNVNKNDSTSVNTNNNNNVSTSTSVNKNENVNKSESTSQSNVKTENTNTNVNRNENISKSETTIKAPPASAIAPMISTYSQDVCVSGVSGAVQTQVFGLSAGKAVRDMNCERLKLSKTLYDMGMKVAAVSMMCQDERVFRAMEMAGTPCPYMGKIGKDATEQWAGNKEERPDFKKKWWKIWGNDQETSEELPVAEAGG